MMKNIKKFLNGKILPNWILIVFAVIIIIFAMLGWKITYDPYLKNCWNAIDAVGGWVSAIISGVAIWFAAFVPMRIAQEQNKIALFEKRFVSYSVFLKYISFAKMIEQIETPDQLCQAFSFNFIGKGDVNDLKELSLMINNDEQQLMSGLFLFSDFCDGKTISDLIQGILEIANLIEYNKSKLSQEDKNLIMLFCHKCKSFENEYMRKMRRQLAVKI